MSEYEHLCHGFEPVYDSRSEILILGSFPSVKSREAGFYYGHPRNRFWKVTAAVTGQREPQTIEEKKAFLLENRIAVYDVIESCDIKGSSDSSIRNVVPADIKRILQNSAVERIFANGKTAGALYRKYIFPATGKEAVILPSTSPANAAWHTDGLIAEWRKIKDMGYKEERNGTDRQTKGNH